MKVGIELQRLRDWQERLDRSDDSKVIGVTEEMYDFIQAKSREALEDEKKVKSPMAGHHGLDMKQIQISGRYRFRKDNKFSSKHADLCGKEVVITEKARTRVTVLIDDAASSFNQQYFKAYPSQLEAIY